MIYKISRFCSEPYLTAFDKYFYKKFLTKFKNLYVVLTHVYYNILMWTKIKFSIDPTHNI